MSDKIPRLICKAAPYSEVVTYRKVFNLNELQGTLHVQLPDEVVEDRCILLQVSDIEDLENSISSDISVFTTPWIDIPVSLLNKDSGIHTYLIKLAHGQTSDVLHVYFSYIVQDDNPDKPYIYMKR